MATAGGTIGKRQFILMADTNTIRTVEHDLHLFNKEFLDFWAQIASSYEVTLQLPYIVLEEIREQKLAFALQNARQGLRSLQHLWAITGKDIKIDIDGEDSVRKSLTAQLRSQFVQLPGDHRLIPVPYEQIDLGELAQRAVQRVSPFEKDKGFKDALILETVNKVIRDNPSRDVALVSRDGAVGVAARALRRTNKNFGFFATFDEFKAFIQVAASKYPSELLHAITSNAGDRFFKAGDESTLWFQSKIEQRLEELFDDPPVMSFASNFRSFFALSSPNAMRNVMAMRKRPSEYSIGDTALAGVVGENTFHWRTSVYYKVEYSWSDGGLLNTEDRMREFKEGAVTVWWSSNLVDEELRDAAVERIDIPGAFMRSKSDWRDRFLSTSNSDRVLFMSSIDEKSDSSTSNDS